MVLDYGQIAAKSQINYGTYLTQNTIYDDVHGVN